MQQWNCERDWWVLWWKFETIFTFRYVRFNAKVIQFWCQIYLFMMLIMIIFDVDYVYFWRQLLLSLFFFCLCDVYILYSLFRQWYSREKKTVKSPQILKWIKVFLRGGMRKTEWGWIIICSVRPVIMDPGVMCYI